MKNVFAIGVAGCFNRSRKSKKTFCNPIIQKLGGLKMQITG